MVNEANRVRNVLAQLLADNISEVVYSATEPDQKTLNLFIDIPDEVFLKGKIPAFGITTKRSRSAGIVSDLYYPVTVGSTTTYYEAAGLTDETLLISIVHSVPETLKTLETKVRTYLTTLQSLNVYNDTDDGFTETADVQIGTTMYRKHADYPFQVDIELQLTYYNFTTPDYYPVETIQNDLSIVDHIDIEEEDDEPEVATTYTITSIGLNEERITIIKSP